MLGVGGFGDLRVAGIALSPDNVAFPLARTARVYVGEQEVRDAFGFPGEIRPDIALLWLHDPARADITLAQARVTSFGIGSLSFITREGIRVLLSEAAGIVISLLVAFSLVALVAAGTMLAAGAHADVQRRLAAIGVQRALGFTPAAIAARHAREAALVALPAAAAGIAVGALVVAGPSASLLGALNEQPPGAALALPLLAGLAAVVALVTARRHLARVAGREPHARGDPARRRPRPAPPAQRRPGARRPARARSPLRARAARALAGLRAHDRGQRRRGDPDARARLAARAAARRPGHGRQALPADRAAEPGPAARRCGRSPACATPRRATSSPPPTRSGSGNPCG